MNKVKMTPKVFTPEELELEFNRYWNKETSWSIEKFYDTFEIFKYYIQNGSIRAANKINDVWQANVWVKNFILKAFELGKLKEFNSGTSIAYFDKNTLGNRALSIDDEIRNVSNAVIRTGCYVSKNTILMPNSFVNIGAYVDEYVLIDSNTVIGSCAQIGKNVHIGAGTQIGGVLEPINSLPVIIEDNSFIGGCSGIFDGIWIKKNVTIGAGTIITGKMTIYDLVKKKEYSATKDSPLIIPENAVIVQGTKSVMKLGEKEISVQTPVIIKYNESCTSVKNEDLLRK